MNRPPEDHEQNRLIEVALSRLERDSAAEDAEKRMRQMRLRTILDEDDESQAEQPATQTFTESGIRARMAELNTMLEKRPVDYFAENRDHELADLEGKLKAIAKIAVKTAQVAVKKQISTLDNVLKTAVGPDYRQKLAAEHSTQSQRFASMAAKPTFFEDGVFRRMSPGTRRRTPTFFEEERQ